MFVEISLSGEIIVQEIEQARIIMSGYVSFDQSRPKFILILSRKQ